MEQRRLGATGAQIPAIGLGCMGMSMWLGERDDDESAKVLLEALDLGVTHFDTADAYGPYRNEELLGRVLKGRRAEAKPPPFDVRVQSVVIHKGTFSFRDDRGCFLTPGLWRQPYRFLWANVADHFNHYVLVFPPGKPETCFR